MPDINKVIKGLEQCGMSSECIGRDCPYWHNVLDDAVKACDCTTELVRDALALLKEQEPIEPEIEGGGSTWWYVCGECRGAIDKADKFCRHCGRKVRRT